MLDLIAALENSVDNVHGDWENEGFANLMTQKIENVFYSDFNFRDLLDDISASQVKPIVVCVNGSVEYHDGTTWIMGNGNHRLAIAIATCAETVLVLFNENPDDYMVSHVSGY